MDRDDDRYPKKSRYRDTKKQGLVRTGMRDLIFFAQESHDRGRYIRCIEQQGLTAFN